MSPRRHIRRSALVWAALPLATSALGSACSKTTLNRIYDNYYGPGGQAGAPADGALGGDPYQGPVGGAGPGGSATGGSNSGSGGGDGEPYPAHPPSCNTKPLTSFSTDLFAKDGALFYFELDEEERQAGDAGACADPGANIPGGGGKGDDFVGGDIIIDGIPPQQGPYQLGEDPDACPTAAKNIRIVAPDSGDCVDTGKVALNLVGSGGFRVWAEIPQFHIDLGAFSEKAFPEGRTLLDLHNGQARTSVVREPAALRLFRALGLPASRSAFVKTQSNVWDTEFSVGAAATHVLVEPYDATFFERELPEVQRAWLVTSNDLFSQWERREVDCLYSKDGNCSAAALDEARTQFNSYGAPLMERANRIDWSYMHRFRCAVALTGAELDWDANGNRAVLAERADGKLIALPVDLEVSANTNGWGAPDLFGWKIYSSQCRGDEECLDAALDTCEAVITEFEGLGLDESLVSDTCTALKEADLDRSADDEACAAVASYYGSRASDLRYRIASLRDGYGGTGGSVGYGGETGVGGSIYPADDFVPK